MVQKTSLRFPLQTVFFGLSHATESVLNFLGSPLSPIQAFISGVQDDAFIQESLTSSLRIHGIPPFLKTIFDELTGSEFIILN